jgi:hypothetical protein
MTVVMYPDNPFGLFTKLSLVVMMLKKGVAWGKSFATFTILYHKDYYLFYLTGAIHMKLIKKTIIAGVIALATSNVATAAVVLNTASDGTLLGASGVNVGGVLYDVTFGDGTFDSSAITSFTTMAGAEAASNALLAQVLIGDYDSLARLTNGCFNSEFCSIETPFKLIGLDRIQTFTTVNGNDISTLDEVATGSYFYFLGANTNGFSGLTMARWALNGPVSVVPEPETYAMMLAGLGFIALRRKQMAAV